MKKIYTKSVLLHDSKTGQFVPVENESEFYYVSDEAPIAWCGGGESGGGGGTQTTQTVEKADPWEGQQPYLRRGFGEAERMFLNEPPPAIFPDSTVVPYSWETNTAMDLQRNRALSGSPIQQAGTDQLTQTLRGDYLNNIGNIYYNPVQQGVINDVVSPLMGNSYLNQVQGIYSDSPMASASNAGLLNTIDGDYLYGGEGFNRAVDAATRQILPQVNSAFERAGMTNSGLAKEAQTKAIADAFANQYGQERQNQMNAMQLGQAQTNALAQSMGQARQAQLQAGQLGQQGTQMLMDKLGTERENQIRSMLFAPQMASLDYQDISKLAEVGAQQEQIEQEKLAEQIAKYDYGQNARASQLAKYMNLVQGNYGGQSYGTSTADLSGGSSSGSNFLGMGAGLLSPLLFGSGSMGGLLGLMGSSI
jgi:hypothetical protein